MTRISALAVLVILAVAFLAAPVIADVIYLKDGRKFEGKVVSENSKEVKFKTVGGVLTFPRGDVEKIEKGLTKKDEYEARRKEIDDDDIEALLDLATWCEEERLVAQKKRIYRHLTKKAPNHPQIRRAMGQVYLDGTWVKLPKDFEEPTVRPGERKEIKGASIALPKDWKVEVKEMTITATGPDPYARAPVLTVEFVEPCKPLESFKTEVSWKRPLEEVSAAGLKGLRSTLPSPDDQGVTLVETLAVLSGPDRGLRIRLVTYGFEQRRNVAAVDLVLTTLKIKAPPADYTNTHYKYCLNLPKGRGWVHKQDKENDLFVQHTGDEPEDWAQLWIVSGAEGDEAREVLEYANNLVEILKKQGDINQKGKVTLGGVEAEYVDGTFLDSGMPLRRRIAWLTRGKYTVLVFYTQHEFGAKRTESCWEILQKSFRFLD